MTRLHTEQQRLYLAPDTPAGDSSLAPALFDTSGRTRALVLELARPADWTLLAAVWNGVQADLGLPAPGIAVSGQDGYQLWMAVQQAVDVAQAQAFLQGLCRRYLPDVAAHRLRLLPTPAAAAATGPLAGADAGTAAPGGTPHPAAYPATHAVLPPAAQGDGDHWSAFVAPDLAPVFADDPWLDGPPSPEGQAELLARLGRINPADFDNALLRLQPAAAPVTGSSATTATTPSTAVSATARTPPAAPAPADMVSATAYPRDDPAAFLRAVMNDASAPLALRVHAAQALLGH